MAVNYTTYTSLAKPTESELAKNWAIGPELTNDNNILIESFTNIPLNSYSPLFMGSVSHPNVGAGEVKAEYSEVQGYIFGGFNIIFVDPGISAGSGAGSYAIQLPVNADNTFYNIGSAANQTPGPYSVIGEGYWSDASSVAGSGTLALDIIRLGGIDFVRLITEAYAGKTVDWVGPTFPATVANQDQISGSFWYKKTT